MSSSEHAPEKDSATPWFFEYLKDHNSQFGEDGVLREIFARIGTKNKSAVECGALNGVHHSNTRYFLAEQGWSGLLIEADETAFEKLAKNYENNEKAICLNQFIGFGQDDSIDAIFTRYNLPTDLDLFVLDIDGNEYHIWEDMTVYRPRVMVVEFNPSIPNDVSFVQPRDMTVQQGSSVAALRELGIKKRYRLVAVTEVNAIFVREEDASPFSHYPDTTNHLRPKNPYETKIFQLYDGTLKYEGNLKLNWRGGMIDEEKLQMYPARNRYFPNGINANGTVRKIKHMARKSPVYPLIAKVRKLTFFRRLIK